MAENEQAQDRTLDPSGKKLGDARAQGQVPRSRDLANLFVIGASVAVLLLLGGSLGGACRELVAQGMSFDAAAATEPARMGERFGRLAIEALLALAPMLAVMVVATVAAPLLVGGWIFVPSVIMPRLERMDPIAGLGRFLSPPSVVELGKVMLLAALLCTVGGFYIVGRLDRFAGLASLALPAAVSELSTLVLTAGAMLAATLATSAAIDVPFQLFRYNQQLKMSVQELKQEERELQGDPIAKQKLRAAQREMSRKRMMAAVPKADVVVTNPTHFAVALKYLEDRHRAPVVVAKGTDDVALRIRELARANGVPQLEAPPLARALYRHVEIGGEVPAALYTAVAQVLAYVFQLRRHAAGQAPRPAEPQGIEVPDGLDPLAPRASA